MAEIKQEVKTYCIHYRCDCGAGEMIPAGVVLSCHPPLYPHNCNKCGKSMTFEKRYPHYITEKLEDEK